MHAPSDDARAFLRQYYGETLRTSSDLATNACCASGAPPAHVAAALSNVSEAVLERFYGCGFPIPVAVDGCRVLDLGCGTGRDVYLLSQLVGPTGFVHGVDMTEAQLVVARDTVDEHMTRFGYETPNVAFHQGFIEDLSTLPIEDSTLDMVVSNCVVNLSPTKDRVLAEVARVLRAGGEFYLSDVVVDRRLPHAVSADPLLHAECLGGALYVHDLLDLCRAAGFADPRVVTRSPITIDHPDLQRKVGAARFESLTLRLFALPDLEPRCEDYGQIATYQGGIPEAPELVWLDDHHAFERGRPERVCGNTAAMLTQTRFAPWFSVTEAGPHFGEFPCDPTLAAQQYADQTGAGAGGCC